MLQVALVRPFRSIEGVTATYTVDAPRGTLKIWKDFLLGKRKDLGQCTQHFFIVPENKGNPIDMAGCKVNERRAYIFNQVGPLCFFGLFEGSRQGLPLPELRVMDKSKVSAEGGTIKTVSEWHVGNNKAEAFITWDFIRFFIKVSKAKFEKVQTFADKNPHFKIKGVDAPKRNNPSVGERPPWVSFAPSR